MKQSIPIFNNDVSRLIWETKYRYQSHNGEAEAPYNKAGSDLPNILPKLNQQSSYSGKMRFITFWMISGFYRVDVFWLAVAYRNN